MFGRKHFANATHEHISRSFTWSLLHVLQGGNFQVVASCIEYRNNLPWVSTGSNYCFACIGSDAKVVVTSCKTKIRTTNDPLAERKITNKQTNKQTNEQTDRQTDRQTNRDRLIWILACIARKHMGNRCRRLLHEYMLNHAHVCIHVQVVEPVRGSSSTRSSKAGCTHWVFKPKSFFVYHICRIHVYVRVRACLYVRTWICVRVWVCVRMHILQVLIHNVVFTSCKNKIQTPVDLPFAERKRKNKTK